MINKISSITPKKLFPVIAAGLMTLTGCATVHQIKTKEYCSGTERSQAEYEEVMSKLGDTKADNQARLDSLVFRDLFNGTILANDSAAVADFNKIYQNRLSSGNSANYLKEKDISIEDYDYIANGHISDAKKQFQTDYYLVNKLFEDYNAKTPEVEKKIETAACFLYPTHQYYFNEVFYPDKDGYCPSKE